MDVKSQAASMPSRGQESHHHQQQQQKTNKNANMPTPAEIQSLIAKELTGLSSAEREKVLEDVHGISTQTNEDPAFIQSCLQELQHHLDTLKAGTSYELAESKWPEYVQNTDFRLMFIRADFYATKAAAERMIKFFEFKKKLFGEDKLGKEITLDDFDENGMEAMESGYAQISPCKDMAGRPIVFFVQRHKKSKSPEDLTRVGFYIYMAATKMPEAQRKGISCVYYYMDSEDGISSRSTNSECRNSLPVYFASLHLCYNDEEVWKQICDNVKKLNASARARFRPHGGTHEEVANELSAYGIPRQAVPVTPEGKYTLDRHHAWLEERRRQEQEMQKIGATTDAPSFDAVAQAGPVVLSSTTSSNSMIPTKDFRCISDESSVGSSSTMSSRPSTKQTSISSFKPLSIVQSRSTSSGGGVGGGSSMNGSGLGVTPLPDDVLFGRGKTVVEHPGNTRFRHVVDIYMNEYESAGRLEKTCIAEVIVRMVKDAHGRFLKRDEGGDWEEVDDSTARKKVAHAFRNRRKLHGF